MPLILSNFHTPHNKEMTMSTQTKTKRKYIRKDTSHSNMVTFRLSSVDLKRLQSKAQSLDLTRGEAIRRGILSFLEQG